MKISTLLIGDMIFHVERNSSGFSVGLATVFICRAFFLNKKKIKLGIAA
jgi:hypothetical protein